MQIAAILAVAVISSGCLKPLVDDVPSHSAHLLPMGATVPSAADSPDLANQISVNSGLDNKAVAAAGNVIARGTGWSAGVAVRFWAFGRATAAPSPMYELYRDTGSGLARLDGHAPFFDAVPGDPGYSPLHSLQQVVVTDAYRDELITDPEALADAIELGLVNPPVPSGTFVASPIVLPALKLEIGGGKPAQPAEVGYAHGHVIGVLRLGGALGVQPAGGFLPTSQVSLLREDHAVAFDQTRPVFQATIPAAPPLGKTANYTALSVVVNVDLAPPFTAASITKDSDLFNRGANGAITSSTDKVAHFEITTTSVAQPLQFEDGQP